MILITVDVTRLLLCMEHRKTRDWSKKAFAYCNEEGDCELTSINMVGFEVVTAVTMKITVLCDAVPRSLVSCRHFRRIFCIISVY